MGRWDNLAEWWARKNAELENKNEIADETTEELDYLLYKNNKRYKIQTVHSWRRRSTKKILNFLKNQHITEFLFYTFNDNIMHILEYGISPWGAWLDSKGNKRYPTSFLEHKKTLDLELSTSNRAYLWEWISKNDINPSKIAIISININELFNGTVNNWQWNPLTKLITIDEPVPVNAINWILLKNFTRINQAKKYIQNNRLTIKLYFGEEGSIEDET